ncbi:MAG: S8 family serine peptidase [Bdellovibrionaceae bacterium]|nr:S8 family serine peptidase [Pseudobdellovibrionaceae bacterium]MBX3033608.1 S8 family serine peptidase [Pseudobdellovibrionaceae bacterium]
MDVFKRLFGLALFSMLAACGGSKSPDTVLSKSSSTVCASSRIESRFIVEWEDGRVSVEEAPDADAFKRDFLAAHLQDIRRAEYDHVITLQQPVAITPQVTPSEDWGQSIVEAQSLWDEGIQGQGVLVGVVDSRVDVTHPQLINNALPGQSFISYDDSNQKMSSHGTHVSGIIAADPARGPVKGLAPRAKILPAPFIANNGSGSMGDAIKALQYAASQGVKIINASWGGILSCNETLGQVFAQLSQQGILLMVAAGNDGQDIDRSPIYPAAYRIPNQLTIAASTPLDFLASWSNSGFNNVHLAAPGAGIFSTIPGGTGLMDGTSMATPFVSGAAALLWSAKPQATAGQIRQALWSSVTVTPNHEYRVATQGRLNVRRAWQTLQSLVP